MRWVKSSGCADWACVEVASVKSSQCANSACVEVGYDGGEVLLRDGKDPDGPVLRFTAEAWRAFTVAIQDGEFD